MVTTDNENNIELNKDDITWEFEMVGIKAKDRSEGKKIKAQILKNQIKSKDIDLLLGRPFRHESDVNNLKQNIIDDKTKLQNHEKIFKKFEEYVNWKLNDINDMAGHGLDLDIGVKIDCDKLVIIQEMIEKFKDSYEKI